MKLRHQVPKINGTGAHREVPVSTTYERVQPHLRRVGITRISDITGLDRIGIPVWNTICPASHDAISVYNGKGDTDLDAKTSAIMEAVERYSAAVPIPPVTVASYPELVESGQRTLDPRDVNLELFRAYRIDAPISWVRGYDIMNEASVLVPMYLAGYYSRYHEVPCYPLGTTNGIASGNSTEEAICHALCELIERDDWTMADLVSNRMQRVIAKGVIGPKASLAAARWLHEKHPNIDLTSLPERACRIVEKYHRAKLSITLKNVTSETGVPTVLAVVSEYVASTFSQSHMGLGTHPDAEVALCRALCEVAQSRVVDINALREDITLPGERVEKYFFHVKRSGAANKEAWLFKPSEQQIRFADLPNHVSEDIADDIRLMLDRLLYRGMDRVIVVDLSPPNVPVRVVRVIVPGIESWVIDRSKLGPRAAGLWSDTLNDISRACERSSAPAVLGGF